MARLSSQCAARPAREIEAHAEGRHAPEMDAALEEIMKTSPTARWAFTTACTRWASTPRRYLAASLDYNLKDGIAETIACPTLVCDAEEDLFFKGQPQQLYDHLTCPKTLIRLYRGGRRRRPLPPRREPPGPRPHLRLARRNSGQMTPGWAL